ncbi:MAG: POTRA domain-containing protein, partial [Janthinobacterium lividum]
MSKPAHLVPKAAVIAASAVLATHSLMAFAVQPFTVQDIRLEGLQRVEPGTVFAYVPLKKGDTFTDDKGSEVLRALYATGFFNDVRVSAEGNIVVIQVQERPAISGV